MTPEALNLLDRLCVPYAERPITGRYVWDGDTIANRADDFFGLHDACHYLVAESDRRKYPDFGLGGGVKEYPPRDMHWFDADAEEIQVSILSSLYRLHLEHEPLEIQQWCSITGGRMRFRNVDTMTLFWHNLEVLDERGFLNCHILNETQALRRMLLMLEDSAYGSGRSIEEIKEAYSIRSKT